MLGGATGSILRLPRVFRATSARTATVRISTRQLETLLDQIESINQRARDLVAGRSAADLSTSLESTSWSVAQCLDHLAQTTNAFLPVISAAIARAPRLTTNRGLRTGALTRLFIRNLEPPYKIRFKVLTALVPREHNFVSARDAFEASQGQLERIIQSAIGLAVDQVRIESPVYARLSYNVYGALRMMAAHQRRHLWQMEQILKALDGASVRKAS
jgi:hypothetical protein